MFFFAPIFTTLTSVAVLISSTVVANANPISHESHQTNGVGVGNCAIISQGANETIPNEYSVHLPIAYTDSTCTGLYNLIFWGQPWSLGPTPAVIITPLKISGWQCSGDASSTQVEFLALPGNGATLSNDFAIAFPYTTDLKCN
jgi:hypothetical protein